MALLRRPSHSITSCTVHNEREVDAWKPLTIYINDWVTMLPSCKGSHRVKRSRRDDIKNHWRGRILAFQITNQKWFARVQHVYLSKDLFLNPSEQTPSQAHYVFPSTCIEWQPVESLSGIFQAIHKELSDILYPGEPTSFFRKKDLYVYFANYLVPSRTGAYGKIESLPVPCLTSLNWETPDRATITSFKYKLSSDIQNAMKPGRISRRIRLTWFIPIHVFVASFKMLQLQRTKTMWLERRLQAADLDQVIGDQWKSREAQHIGDLILCKVSPNSLALSYNISRQSLVMGFDYRRWRRHVGSWIPLDSEENSPEFELDINIEPFDNPRKILVNGSWTLKDLRETLEFLDTITHSYRFKLDDLLIRRRAEQSISCMKCLPPVCVTMST